MEGGIRSGKEGLRACCSVGARIHLLWQAAIHLRLKISMLFWVGLSFASLGTFFCNRNNRGCGEEQDFHNSLLEGFKSACETGKGRWQGLKKKNKNKRLWSTCDILQPGQFLRDSFPPVHCMYSSEQQTTAEFAASSRHLRNSKVLIPWLEKQGDRSFTPVFLTEEVANNLAHL